MTTTLNAVVTHLDAEAVDGVLAYLRATCPRSRFVVCHGGRREEFERIAHAEKLFIEDPSLRGAPISFQSYHEILGELYRCLVERDPDVDSLYVIEYDHVILRPDFEERLREVATATRADFMGKNCVVRNGTNWTHYVRFRGDERLGAHLRAVSVREDATRMFGCLGDGFWLNRAALEAYVSVQGHPPCYGELYVPTLLHHLGFHLVDLDAHSELYRDVRWHPTFDLEQVLRVKRRGGSFVHPFKDTGALPRIGQAPGSPSCRPSECPP